MKPLISFIIPSYNVEMYIERAILSLLNQKCQDFEIIIVDDSTDNTVNLIERIFKEWSFENYKIFQNGERRGPSFARNKGLKEARGEYVIFLDADDYVDKSIVLELKKAISEYKYPEMVCWKFKCEYYNYRIPKFDFKLEEGIYNGLEILHRILINRDFWITTISATYRREEILKRKLFFSEDIFDAEDLEFIWKFLAIANRVLFLDKVLSFYVVRRESLSRTFSPKRFTHLIAFDRVINYFNENIQITHEENERLIKSLEEYKILHFLAAIKQMYPKSQDFLKNLRENYSKELERTILIARRYKIPIFYSKLSIKEIIGILIFAYSPNIFILIIKFLSYINNIKNYVRICNKFFQLISQL